MSIYYFNLNMTMAVKITIVTTRPSVDIPWSRWPDFRKNLFDAHKKNLIHYETSISDDKLTTTSILVWKDVASLIAWNQERTTKFHTKEVLLLDYYRKSNITYWSTQELIDD